MATDAPIDQDGPVTVVVRHRVRPGKETEFEEWLRGISRAALKFEGCLGFNVIRPADPGQPEYVVLFRFDTFAHLETWEASETRREWLEKVAPLTVHTPMRERHTGMEVWFTPPAGRAQPPRYKMAIVTLLAIFPLISLVQLLLAPLLSHWPLLLRTLATSSLLVCLMTYVVMPLMTRLFARWLYGPPR
jgi:antibiotic biosynthesis monooxygenase (ABM) superfamily enzyme